MHEITPDDIDFSDRYVTTLCRRCGRYVDEDAIQWGRLGLVDAADTYDPEKASGENFHGWASYQIRHQIFRNHFGFGLNPEPSNIGVEFLDEICYSKCDNEKNTLDRIFVKELLEEIPPHQRLVVFGKCIRDQTFRKMSDEFGGSQQGYSARYRKAKATLKKRHGREIQNVKV